MDSTCLGTVHELVARGGVVLAGVTPAVRALFEELSMQQVLAAIREDIPAAPELYALGTGGDLAAVQKRILQAHEALSALSERNREEFKEVVESLRGEQGRAEDDHCHSTCCISRTTRPMRNASGQAAGRGPCL